jgi:hypothetical protein
MVTRIALSAPPTIARRTRSGYQTAWTMAAHLATAVFATIAMLQSPRLPLLALTVGLAALGGLVFARLASTAHWAWPEYREGAIRVGVTVLVIVGAGHQLTAALATAAVLAGSAPQTLRWINGS